MGYGHRLAKTLKRVHQQHRSDFKLKTSVDGKLVSTKTTGGIIRAMVKLNTWSDVVIKHMTSPDTVDVEEITQAHNLYQFFRITGVKLKWVPVAPNDTTAQRLFNPLYIGVNHFELASAANNDALTAAKVINLSGFAVRDMTKTWSYYTSVGGHSRDAGGVEGGWFSCSATDTPTDIGYIALYSEGLNTVSETNYGRLLVTYYVEFKGRR